MASTSTYEKVSLNRADKVEQPELKKHGLWDHYFGGHLIQMNQVCSQNDPATLCKLSHPVFFKDRPPTNLSIKILDHHFETVMITAGRKM